jgi:hypothetical protein
MPFEFVARNGIIALASSIVTGSVTATQGFTGSLFGTSSWATNAATSSFILNAVSASFAATASSADNFLVRGTLTAQTIVAQTITSSTDFVTGSTRFGTLLTNTHVFSGSVTMNPGGLFVSSSGLVGIGTTSPNVLLTIGNRAGNATFGGDVLINQANSTLNSIGGLEFKPDGANNGYGYKLQSLFDGNSAYDFTIQSRSNSATWTERIRITSGGNVGIGTTSPTHQLSVYNVSRDSTTALNAGNSNIIPAISIQSGTGSWASTGNGFAYYYNTANGNLDLYRKDNSTTENHVMTWVRASGNVGIGTTSPGVILDVNGSGIRITNATPNVYFNNTTVQWKAYMPSNNFAINDAVRDVLTLGYNGAASYFQGCNVGIGTTSPLSLLNIRHNGSGSSVTYSGLFIQNSSGAVGSNIAARIAFDADGGSTGYGFIEQRRDGTDSLYLVTRNSAVGHMGFETSGSTRIFIAGNTGNVGIGTTTPSVKLQVVGDGLFNSNTNTNLTINSNGGVAILTLTNSAGSQLIYGGTGGSNVMDFYTNSTFRVRIDASGNVGIGSTSPGAKLDVTGNVRATSFTGSFSGSLTGLASNATTASFASTVAGGTANYIPYWSATNTLGNSIIYQNTNTIGINTTSPTGSNMSSLLHINGAAAVLRVGPYYSTGGDRDFIELTAGGTDTKVTSPNERFWIENTAGAIIISASANVGIGTTAPAAKLDVSGDIFGRGVIFGYASSTQYGGLSYGLLGSTDGFLFLKTGGTTTVQLQASGSSYFNAGNVGIGTTSPTDKLDVSGNIVIGNSGNKLFNGPSADSAGLYFSSNITNISGYSGIIFRSSTTNVASQTERMRIANDGNVGIGTTSPSATLTVSKAASNYMFDLENATEALFKLRTYNSGSGAGSTFPVFTHGLYYGTIENAAVRFYRGGGGTDGFLTFTTSGTERVRIDNGGNVGIGTTAPARLLHIRAGAAAAGAIRVDSDNGNVANVLEVPTNGDWSFSTNSQEVMRLSNANGGRVGIGTTTPTARLHVSGTTGGVFEVDGAAAVNALYVSASGRIGIGNITPGYTLDVTGNIHSTTLMLIDASNAAYLRGGDDHEWWDINVANTAGLYGTSNSAVGGLKLGSGGPTLYGASGNLGIGTTSPGYKLDVSGSGRFNSTQIIGPDGTYGATYPMISFTGIANGSHRIFAGTSDDMYFAAATSRGFEFRPNGGTSSALNILSGGNVGIGTTSPSEKLSVIGNIDSTSTGTKIGFNVSDSFTAYGSSSAHYGMSYARDTNPLKLSGYFGVSVFTVGTEKLSIAQNGATTITSDSTEQVTIRTVTNTNRQLLIGYNYTPNYGYIQAVEQGTAFRNLLLNPNGGNVGIGTTSPSFKLDVNGTFRATTYTTGDYINYGFAISSPSANFGNARSYIRIQTTASGARIVSFKIRLSTTWSWVPGFGYIDADVSYYFDGTSLVYPSVNVTSATGQALNSIAIGDLVIENGYISVPVYITNSNSLFIKIEGSPNFDYSLITTTAWSSVTFPGSNAVYIAGRLGIGTSSPSTKLHIVDSTEAEIRTQYSTTSSGKIITGNGFTTIGSITNDPLVFVSNNTERMRITNGGNVGIGTTSPSFKLDVNGIIGLSGFRFADKDGNYNRIFEPAGNVVMYLGNASDPGNYYDNTSHNFRNRGGSTFYMVINASGNVGIGSTSPAYKLDVSGSIRATGDIIAFSDARVKENVQTVENALSKVVSLRGVTYTRNDSEDKSEKIGVIAQEVLEVLPQVVQQDDKGNYSVAYGNMVGVLIEAIKEQQQQIDDLKYLLQTINK